MTIQDLGSLGELLAAAATLATLVYLAVQVRQNTQALRSSTFQEIASQMAQNVEPLVYDQEVAALTVRGSAHLEELDEVDRVRFYAILIMSFRRMEAVYIHSQLGSIAPDLTRGFELSMLTNLQSPGGAAWWDSAKVTFSREFVDHVDAWLAANRSAIAVHPSTGMPLEEH